MFKKILLIVFLLFLSAAPLLAQNWAYLGFSKSSPESIFYIFVLNEKTGKPDEQKITQKHVFGVPQKLADGRIYSSIVLSRTLNCTNKTISTERAVFSNGVGSTVGRYENKGGVKNIIEIDEGSDIDPYLYSKYCSGL